MPLSLTIRPTKTKVNTPSIVCFPLTLNRSKSIPFTLPWPSTLIGFLVMPWFCKSAITPFPSGMMCVAQAHVSQSVTIRIRRFHPVSVGHTKPVKVCTLTGTLAILAAIIHSNPAFGVIECTIFGFSQRSALMILHNAMMSFFGEICLSIGIAMVVTPCFSFACSISFPGEDSNTTSYLLHNSSNIPSKKERDMDTVQARMIFIIFE